MLSFRRSLEDEKRELRRQDSLPLSPRSDESHEHAQLGSIVRHFALRGVLVVALWTLRRMQQKWAAQRRTQESPPPFRLITHPERDLKPSHPPWLTAALPLAEGEELVAASAPQCPLVAEFVDHVRRVGLQVDAGLPARRLLFQLEEGFHYLNHGSYGASLQLASRVQAWYRDRLESQPVRFMEQEALPALISARNELAELVGADPRDVVPVTNATGAVNAVVASTRLKPGDLLMMTNITYAAVKHILAKAAKASRAGIMEVQLSPAALRSDDLILAAFRRALEAGRRRVRLVVLDHVSSFPPVEFPVQRLCTLCREYGAKVLVDGAHAIGALPLSIPALGCHYYTSNLHKWLCTSKGAALLWVARPQQAHVRPQVTSHGYGLGFQGEFLWQGTADPSAWLAAPAALAVLQALPMDALRAHNASLLARAIALLCESWSVREVMGGVGPFACMAAVELPHLEAFPASPASAAALHRLLREQFRIEVPCVWWEGRMWVRLSAQLYNTLEDYRALVEAVRQLQAQPGRPNGAGKPANGEAAYRAAANGEGAHGAAANGIGGSPVALS